MNAIESAAREFLAAKAREHAAAMERIEAESKLCALVGVMEDGTTTSTDAPGLIVKTMGKLSYSLDEPAWRNVSRSIPPAIADRLVRYKAEPCVRALKELRSNEPELYAVFAQALTIKPTKPYVTVEYAVAKAA